MIMAEVGVGGVVMSQPQSERKRKAYAIDAGVLPAQAALSMPSTMSLRLPRKVRCNATPCDRVPDDQTDQKSITILAMHVRNETVCVQTRWRKQRRR